MPLFIGNGESIGDQQSGRSKAAEVGKTMTRSRRAMDLDDYGLRALGKLRAMST
jgi:hypothetical protein